MLGGDVRRDAGPRKDGLSHPAACRRAGAIPRQLRNEPSTPGWAVTGFVPASGSRAVSASSFATPPCDTWFHSIQRPTTNSQTAPSPPRAMAALAFVRSARSCPETRWLSSPQSMQRTITALAFKIQAMFRVRTGEGCRMHHARARCVAQPVTGTRRPFPPVLSREESGGRTNRGPATRCL